MLITIDSGLLAQQDYDSALRAACDQLTASGIRNYIHYQPTRSVELVDERKVLRPVVDHAAGGIRLEAQPTRQARWSSS